MRRSTVLAAAFFAFGLFVATGPAMAGPGTSGRPARARASGTPGTSAESGRYIVVLADDAGDPAALAADLGRQHGFQAGHVYADALHGFSATMPARAAARLEADRRVRLVSEDRPVRLAGWRSAARDAGDEREEQRAPSGVRRIGAARDDRRFALPNRGRGIGIAVLDTGIDLTHPDLQPVENGKNCLDPGRDAHDDHGHGTHVAGIIAARDNELGVVGVAPEATLYAVKVVDRTGYGAWSTLICGVDWVTKHAAQLDIQLANMSLDSDGGDDGRCGTLDGDALHHAICRSVAANVSYVVAAGNGGRDAKQSAPGAYREVIAVSALGDDDGRAGGDRFEGWSNFGGAVDIAAPGVDIYSTDRDGHYTTYTGTSTASPHVAGASALLLASHRSRYGHFPPPLEVLTMLRATGECPDGLPGARIATGDPNHNNDPYTCAWPWHDASDPTRRREPLVRATGEWPAPGPDPRPGPPNPPPTPGH